MPVRKSGPDKMLQQAHFMEIARKLGCDENPAAFDEKLKMVAKVKPSEVSARLNKKVAQDG